MRIGVALAILVPSACLFALAGIVGRSRRGFVADLLAGAAGAGLGVGALFFQRNVSRPSWVLAPALVATLAIVHARVVFADRFEGVS